MTNILDFCPNSPNNLNGQNDPNGQNSPNCPNYLKLRQDNKTSRQRDNKTTTAAAKKPWAYEAAQLMHSLKRPRSSKSGFKINKPQVTMPCVQYLFE